jgi:hypothetical protein
MWLSKRVLSTLGDISYGGNDRFYSSGNSSRLELSSIVMIELRTS